MKDKTVAALIAFFAGGLGIHKFYLGQAGAGLLYLLFCWTLIPSMIAFFECIGFLMMSDQEFNARFNSGLSAAPGANFSFGRESTKDKASALGELKKLYESDVITAEEYEEKRRKILDSI